MADWRRLLSRPWIGPALAGLAVALCLPALAAGWSVDDHYQRLALLGRDPFHLGRQTGADIFRFLDGDPASTQRFVDAGLLPWWTWPGLHLSFFRPLAAFTHWLDYRLWPDSAALMHAHSLIWLGALVAAVAGLYRRLPAPAHLAGLAALLYAVDDARGWPAGWLANRNALIAGFFGVLALSAHVRWRRERWRPGVLLAPVALAAALAAGEAAVAVAGYLIAFELCLAEGSLARRLARLAPAAGVVAVWRFVHGRLGYGVDGSGVYLDPLHQPLEFVRAAAERGPILLLGQWGVPSSGLALLAPPAGRFVWWLAALAVLGLLAALLWPLVRRDRTARFWALGMVLALVPPLATFPHDRLLTFVGLGAMALTALLLEEGSRRPDASSRRFVRTAAVVLAAIHLVLAPLALPLSAYSPALIDRVTVRDGEALAGEPGSDARTAVLVNYPVPFLAGHTLISRAGRGLSHVGALRVLAASNRAIEIERVDEHTLKLRPAAGFLAGPLDDLVRGRSRPFRPGDRAEVAGMSVEILSLTPDGRPAEALFRFEAGLDDPSLLWLASTPAGPAPLALPAIGAREVLPPVAPLAATGSG